MTSPRRAQVIIAAGALFVAAIATVLAIPRVLAEGTMVLADRILLDIEAENPVTPQALDILWANRESAARYIHSGRSYREAGHAQTKLAERAGFFRAEGRPALAQAIRLYRMSLAVAPIDPLVWTRLAYLEWAMHGAGLGPVAALEMSFRTGLHWPEIAAARFELAVIQLRAGVMDARQRQMIAREIARIEAEDPEYVARVLRRWDAGDLLGNR